MTCPMCRHMAPRSMEVLNMRVEQLANYERAEPAKCPNCDSSDWWDSPDLIMEAQRDKESQYEQKTVYRPALKLILVSAVMWAALIWYLGRFMGWWP